MEGKNLGASELRLEAMDGTEARIELQEVMRWDGMEGAVANGDGDRAW